MSSFYKYIQIMLGILFLCVIMMLETWTDLDLSLQRFLFADGQWLIPPEQHARWSWLFYAGPKRLLLVLGILSLLLALAGFLWPWWLRRKRSAQERSAQAALSVPDSPKCVAEANKSEQEGIATEDVACSGKREGACPELHSERRRASAVPYADSCLSSVGWHDEPPVSPYGLPQCWRKPFLWLLRWRRSLLLFSLALALIPLCLGGAKKWTNIYCPYQLVEFGGTHGYQRLLEPVNVVNEGLGAGQCFPAGHATGGFALMVLFFCLPHRLRWTGLGAGMFVGWMMGGYQMLRGQHFLSHTLFTMVGSWVLILLLVLVIDSFLNKR